MPPPDSGVGSAASSNNGNSISDVESQELLEVSRGQSSTETAPLVNLNFDPNPWRKNREQRKTLPKKIKNQKFAFLA